MAESSVFDGVFEQPLAAPTPLRDPRQELQSTMAEAVATKPDEFADLWRTAKTLRMPTEIVGADKPFYSTRARLDTLPLDRLLEAAPITAQWLSTPENAKLAHDDLDRLSMFERVFRAPRAGFGEGLTQVDLGEMHFRALTGKLAPEEQAKRELLKREMQAYELDAGTGLIDRAVREGFKMLPQIGAALEGGIREAPRYVGAGAAMGAGIGSAFMGVGAVPGAVVGAKAGFATGMNVGAFKTTYRQEAGFAYDEFSGLKDASGKPLDDDVARAAAHVVGAVNGGLELVGLHAIKSLIPGADKVLGPELRRNVADVLMKPSVQQSIKNVAKRTGFAVGVEASQEMLQEVSTIVGRELAQKKTGGDFQSPGVFTPRTDVSGNTIEESYASRVLEAGVSSALGTLVIGTGGNALHISREQSRLAQSQANIDMLRDVADAAQRSKVLERAPDKVRELLSRLKDGQGLENVYVPSTFWQSHFEGQGVDPAAVAHSVGATNYAEALAAGSDVAVPYEQFVTRIAAVPEQFNVMVDELRLNAGDLTNRELNALAADHTRIVEDLKASIVGGQQEGGRAVIEDVAGQLVATGTERGTAERLSQLYRAFDVLAQRMNAARPEGEKLTAEQLFERYQLRIERPMPDVLTRAGTADITIDPLLDRLRAGDVPTDRQVFGPSLVEFLQSKGGLKDEGGELRARDVDTARRPFQQKLARADGLGLDHAAELAVEAGYLQERDINGLLAALDAELGGTPVYALGRENPQQLALQQDLAQLDGALRSLGVDLTLSDNARVRQALDAALAQERQSGAGATTLEQRFAADKRGSITFGADRKFTISIFEKGDLSTVIHETGHFYLEVLGDLATDPDAPQALRDDYSTLLKWFGVKSREQIGEQQHEQFARGFEAYIMEGKAPAPELQGPFQRFKAWLTFIYKQVAALNVKLNDDVRGVFDRMLATDAEIEAAKQANPLLAMFATAKDAGMSEVEFNVYRKQVEQATEAAKEQLLQRLMTEYRREQEKWWKDARSKVQAEVTAEVDEQPAYRAFEALAAGQLPDGTPLRLDRQSLIGAYGQAFLARLPRRARRLYSADGGVHHDAAAELLGFASGDALMQALVNLRPRKDLIEAETDMRMRERHGDMRFDGTISDKAMAALHSEARAQALMIELKALKRKQHDTAPIARLATAQADREHAYERRWMEAERKLAVEIERGTNAESIRQLRHELRAVKESADAALWRERHDRAYEQRWADAERRLAVEIERGANQGVIEGLRGELRAVRDNAREGRALLRRIPDLSFFRQAAQGIIGAKLVRDIRPDEYLAAERRASKAALEAAAKDDFEPAAAEKQRQLLNHYLFLEATKAKDEADRIVDRMARYDTTAVRERLGKAGGTYLEQIDALLDQYEFRRSTSIAMLDRRETLVQWYESQKELGFEPSISPEILERARKVSYKQLPMDELRALDDAVTSIATLARLKNKLLKQRRDVELTAAIDELRAAAEENSKHVPQSDDPMSRCAREKLADWWRAFDRDMVTVRGLANILDGGRADGPWHRYFMNPASEAQSEQLDMLKAVGASVTQLIEEHVGKAPQRMAEALNTPLGPMSRYRVISIALNMGNDSNLKKLVEGGYGRNPDGTKKTWAADQLQTVVSELDGQDWHFIQGVWDTLEGLWPQVAALEKRVSGVEPTKIERRAFSVTARDGASVDLAGGYYPAKYDSNYSGTGAKQETGPLAGLAETGYIAATTPRGHTKARTEAFSAPMLLDFEYVLQRHLAGVIKDLTHREFLIDANRLLKDQRVRTTIQDYLGRQYVQTFDGWLLRVANDGNVSPRDGNNWLDNFIEGARTNAVTVSLGFKVATMFAQVAGVPNSIEIVGPGWFGRGLSRSIANPSEAYRFVTEKSGEMRHRFDTIDRDVRDELRRMSEGQVWQWKAAINRAAFVGINVVDRMVTVPTWLGAYEKGLAQGMGEEEAVHSADDAVVSSQGAGGAKDLSTLQGKRGAIRMLTMFYTPFAAQYNRLRFAWSKVGRDGAQYLPEAIVRTAMIAMIPNVLADLLAARGPKECQPGDAACYSKWTAVKMTTGLTATVPILREIGNLAENAVMGQKVRDIRVSPIVDAWTKGQRAISHAWEAASGERAADDNMYFDLLEAGGYVVGLPTGQVRVTVDYLYDLLQGDERPENIGQVLHGVLFRRSAKQNP
jgi:hypothetical protein